MLEASKISDSSALPVFRTPAELDKGWSDVLDVVNMLKVPANEPRRTALYRAWEAWDLLRNTERPDWSKPYEPNDLQFQQHSAMFQAQKPIAEQLAAEYPQKATGGKTGPVVTLPELLIWGRVPPAVWVGLVLLGGAVFMATGKRTQFAGVGAKYSARKLRERVAEKLGWSVKDTEKFSFQMLREMVKDKSPKLAHEISVAIRSGDLWFEEEI